MARTTSTRTASTTKRAASGTTKTAPRRTSPTKTPAVSPKASGSPKAAAARRKATSRTAASAAEVAPVTTPAAEEATVPQQTTRRPARRRRPKASGPRLTATGIAGLQSYVERLHADLRQYRDLMSDPKRDERVVLDMERLLEDITAYEALIAEAEVLDEIAADLSDVVELGTRVRVRFADRSTEIVRVVHPAEAFLDDERVSAEAPLAKALMGLRAGDRAEIQAPRGPIRFTVVAVGAAVDDEAVAAPARRTRKAG